MANLKAIRSRIKSVQATQKITRAMRLVAAAKVRRAQARVQAARPFTSHIVKLLGNVIRDTAPIDLQDLPLLQVRPVKATGIVVLGSDRGLCGSYNVNVFRAVQERLLELQSAGVKPYLILVGLKAVAFFKHSHVEKIKTYTLLPAIPTVEEAKLIANQIVDLFVSGKLDSVEIIGTQFISILHSSIITTKFLPAGLPAALEHKQLEPEMLFEPSIQNVLSRELIPKYIENVMFQVLLDSAASELAARMNAMTNASNNARDLISALTLSYNKARQSSITQELLEIVGGAEALRG